MHLQKGIINVQYFVQEGMPRSELRLGLNVGETL